MIFALAKIPQPSTEVGFENRAANLASDAFVEATASPRTGLCFCQRASLLILEGI